MKTQIHTRPSFLVLTIAVLWLPLAATPTLACPAVSGKRRQIGLPRERCRQGMAQPRHGSAGSHTARSIVPPTGAPPTRHGGESPIRADRMATVGCHRTWSSRMSLLPAYR